MTREEARTNDHPEEATILWFRADLRLAGNPALAAALARGGPVVPVFIWAPEEEGKWSPGPASRWWLGQSLRSLDRGLKRRGSRLLIETGSSESALRRIIEQTGARAVYWNRRYEPAIWQRDTELKSRFQADGVDVETFNSALLVEPWEVSTKSGGPFRVFTPFWKACLNRDPPPVPHSAPSQIPHPRRWPDSLTLDALELDSGAEQFSSIRTSWTPSEAGAAERLNNFLKNALHEYAEGRDRPDLEDTSELSPYLHFGEASPQQVWHAVQAAEMTGQTGGTLAGSESFLRQLYWREFAYHLLFHEPQTAERPLREEFAVFPWSSDDELIHIWQEGCTGFPYIDAGMRQLRATGWMHNRVRMAVASFLVKDLLFPWQEGAKWFWDTLVDADLANNTLGWQWTAGCGADAAPFFRIFNPVKQGERFDPHGDYVRRWVPEVAKLPDKYLHRSWVAPNEVLTQAQLRLGKNYPRPIVDHAEARVRALQAYEAVRQKR